MSLRGRLAGAFFALIFGPALLTVTLAVLLRDELPGADDAVGARQAVQALRVTIAAHCQTLQVTAGALAGTASVRGESFVVSPPGVRGPWALCSVGPVGVPLNPGVRVTALAARAEIRDRRGVLRGYAYALQRLDAAYLSQLSVAAGRTVTVRAAGTTAIGTTGVGTTGVGTTAVGQAAVGQAAGGTAAVAVIADAAQPVPLWLSARASPPGSAPATVVALLSTTVVVAAALAWWLAGIVTRPVAMVLGVVERALAGDLTVRSRLRGRDEVGRLGRRLDALINCLQVSQRLSITDPLTGLGNLRHLNESLRIETERAARFGRCLGILVMDLDHFKAVNDSYGHRAGDAVLVEFARRVRGVVREVDLVFRQGGEEFVILLPETDILGSTTVARRLGDAVRDQPVVLAQSGPARPALPAATHLPGQRAPRAQLTVTVSIGIAVFPRHGGSGSAVLDAADAALYAAKAAGRDTYALAALAGDASTVGTSSPQHKPAG